MRLRPLSALLAPVVDGMFPWPLSVLLGPAGDGMSLWPLLSLDVLV